MFIVSPREYVRGLGASEVIHLVTVVARTVTLSLSDLLGYRRKGTSSSCLRKVRPTVQWPVSVLGRIHILQTPYTSSFTYQVTCSDRDVESIVTWLSQSWHSSHDRKSYDPSTPVRGKVTVPSKTSTPFTFILNGATDVYTLPWTHKVSGIERLWTEAPELGKLLCRPFLGFRMSPYTLTL